MCLLYFFSLIYSCLFLFSSSYIFLTWFVRPMQFFFLNGTQHRKSVRSIQTHCFWESTTFKTSVWITCCRNLMARCHIRLCFDPFQSFSKLFTPMLSTLQQSFMQKDSFWCWLILSLKIFSIFSLQDCSLAFLREKYWQTPHPPTRMGSA